MKSLKSFVTGLSIVVATAAVVPAFSAPVNLAKSTVTLAEKKGDTTKKTKEEKKADKAQKKQAKEQKKQQEKQTKDTKKTDTTPKTK